MSKAHPTVEPEQAKTDTFAVLTMDLRLVSRVDVPRYSQPNTDGVELSPEKRRALAVHRVAGDNVPDGVPFKVMESLDAEPKMVTVEENPSFDGVWDPTHE